jgi:hypothetical protein
VIVPTLDTPMPAGKTAIWCGSFQLAWGRLREDVLREPIRLMGAEELCERLNNVTLPAETIPEENYDARAGLVRDGIAQQIREDMRRRFPMVELPSFAESGNVAIALAFLQGKVDGPIATGATETLPQYGVRPYYGIWVDNAELMVK